MYLMLLNIPELKRIVFWFFLDALNLAKFLNGLRVDNSF